MRMTEQRRIIARVLAAAEDHPDVEELYRRCAALDNRISISTVYRTVKLFEDSGIIERHEFRDGRARYEQIQENHHDHLIDLRTGKVIDSGPRKSSSFRPKSRAAWAIGLSTTVWNSMRCRSTTRRRVKPFLYVEKQLEFRAARHDQLSRVVIQAGMSEGQKVYIKSFGCQMNVYDSNRMADMLAPEALPKPQRRTTPTSSFSHVHIREKAPTRFTRRLGAFA